MKTLHNKIKITIGVLVIAALAVSCLPKHESMEGAGQTLVKLFPSVYNLLPFDAIATPQTAILFEVRRDVNSSAALETTTTVVLKYDADTAMINQYNAVNGTSYIPLPDTLGTVSPAISGGAITLDFAAGDFSKTITISVPSAGNFDFSKHYALAFMIQSVSGTGILSKGTNDTILCEVLAKNKYDGLYTVTGSFDDYVYDAGGTAYTSDYPINIQLQTSGALSVNRYDADAGSYSYFFDGLTALFGAWTPSFVFDANDNVINCVNTSTDSPARGRTCYLYTGADAINHFDAATKTLDVSFGMHQLNVSPQYRSLMIEHYVYLGPR